VYGQEDARARDRGIEVLCTIDCAVVLAPRCILAVQFYSREDALFTPNAANKLDDTNHAAWHVDRVADVYVLSVCAHPV
jgi:hypothetical protein